MHEFLLRLRRARAVLTAQLGRKATEEELAEQEEYAEQVEQAEQVVPVEQVEQVVSDVT